MKIMSENQKVGIYWEDVRVYEGDGLYDPTQAYTEGEMVVDESGYILIKNPETIIISKDRPMNHPKKKSLFYYIPKSLITKITKYESEK